MHCFQLLLLSHKHNSTASSSLRHTNCRLVTKSFEGRDRDLDLHNSKLSLSLCHDGARRQQGGAHKQQDEAHRQQDEHIGSKIEHTDSTLCLAPVRQKHSLTCSVMSSHSCSVKNCCWICFSGTSCPMILTHSLACLSMTVAARRTGDMWQHPCLLHWVVVLKQLSFLTAKAVG